MRTIKFINKNKSEFAVALRKNVNEYFILKGISTKGNWGLVLKAFIMVSLYIVPFVLMLTVPISDWLIFPFSVLMGIGMSGLAISVTHDAVHGSLSKRNWLNKFLGASMYVIGGSTFIWKVQHNILHHTYTNIEGYDEDLEPKGSLRLSRETPLKKIHRFQHIYAFFLYCLMTLSWTYSEYFRLAKYNKAGFTRQQGSTPVKEMTRMVFTKTTYLLIIIGLPMLFAPFSWWMILLGFLVMHAVAGIYLTTIFQLAHMVEEAKQPLPDSENTICNEWMIHELETTVNFSRKGRFFNWMLGGLNFQIEHHLFPNICHVHYPAIAPIVEKTAKDFGLPYHENKTFLGALGSHVRMLRALGR